MEPEGVWSITKLDKKLDALRLVPSQRAILEGNLHRDLFLSEVDKFQPFQAASYKLRQAGALVNSREVAIPLLNTMDRVNRAAFDSQEVMSCTSPGFLHSPEAAPKMDTYGLGPQYGLFGTINPDFQGQAFPDNALPSLPNLTWLEAKLSPEERLELNKQLQDHQSYNTRLVAGLRQEFQDKLTSL